jgi:enoyl-CoA hydratase/carnithine racemase
MTKAMREPGLRTLGFDGVLDLFRKGSLPASAEDLIGEVFGGGAERGSLVISGASGIVGAGKAMQLGSRLHTYGVRVVGLDLPGAPDGIGRQYPGLVRAFGRDEADRIMANTVRLHYDGKRLPAELRGFKPRFLLEAIPEILELKRAHYEVFRAAFPGAEIRSVTSGFPSSALGVPIAHPAFPHEINKVWEVVEAKPSAVTRLFWALGLIPVPVGDYWSFVLDVLFCGVTHAALQYHGRSNMPFWKADKFVRRALGPNPFRAHDAIGAKGADFLTWSCLHHLAEHYGGLFRPTPELVERKDSGRDWYPPEHSRPLVDWKLTAEEAEEFDDQILGAVLQMTSLMLHEKRAALPYMNAIGELCAQFRSGILAVARRLGPEACRAKVAAYQAAHPDARGSAWHPEAFDGMNDAGWRQLYVNAEHDGRVGVITFGRESYNGDVDAELNRAIDWLRAEGIERVIVTGDFHLSTQLVGADTSEFYPALGRIEDGVRIAEGWSKTARRLHREFRVSVGFIGGKRALGGFLELMMHCHYLIAVDGTELGMPEVTLPVVPGMEGCHWTFRKSKPESWPEILRLLLGGRPVKAMNAVGWLADFAGPLDEALRTAWAAASGDSALPPRKLEERALSGIPTEVGGLPETENPATLAARKAILDTIQASCGAPLAEALVVQAKHSAAFMTSAACREGRIGAEAAKTLAV